VQAVESAILSPLLENSVDGARGVLINFIGGRDLTLQEINQAAELVSNRVDDEAQIIFGATVDDEKRDRVRVMILATGFSAEPSAQTALPVSKPKVDAPPVKLIYEETGRQRPLTKPPDEEATPGAGGGEQEEEDLDIPAFLRRLRKQ
jgi:cell division protein FtsZ